MEGMAASNFAVFAAEVHEENVTLLCYLLHKIQQEQRDCWLWMSATYHSMTSKCFIILSSLSSCLSSLLSCSEIFLVRSCVDTLSQKNQQQVYSNSRLHNFVRSVKRFLKVNLSLTEDLNTNLVKYLVGYSLVTGRKISYHELARFS